MKLDLRGRVLGLALMTAFTAANAQMGPIGATSSVTIHGLIDAGFGPSKGAPTGVTATDRRMWKNEAGNLSTSFWGVRGVERLGDDLSAIFSLESFIRNDTGQHGRSDAVTTPAISVAADPFWAKASWVGLDSKQFGRLRLGTMTTPLFISTTQTNAFGDSTAYSPIVVLMYVNAPSIFAGGTGWSNSATYETPNIAGFSLALQGSLGEGSGGRNVGGRLSYVKGPFTAVIAHTDVKTDPLNFSQGTTRSNTKNSLLGVVYDFQVVKLFAHLGRLKTDGSNTPSLADNDVSHRIWDVSASVPVGNGRFMVAYGRRDGDETHSPQTQRQLTSLGYTYSLSKRTDLYALMRADKTTLQNAPALTSVTSAKGSSYAVGFRHYF